MAKRVVRSLTAAEKKRHAEIRKQVMKEFPPAKQRKHQPVRTGIACGVTEDAKGERIDLLRGRKASGNSESQYSKRRRVWAGCEALQHRSHCQGLGAPLGIGRVLACTVREF